MAIADEKNTSANEESHGSSRTPEDPEKRYSSNAESVTVETVTKPEKTLLDQEALPIKQTDAPDEAASLKKLDSKVIDVENDDPFRHLPEHERAILKRQTDVPEVKVGYFTLYRYATKMDILILIVSATSAIAAGAAMPLMTVIFGNLTGLLSNFEQNNVHYEVFVHDLTHYVLYFIYLAIGEWVTMYIATVGFIYVGEHMTSKIREEYLAAMLRQNIAFFDLLGAGEITTRITADTNIIQDGISEKVGLTLNALATFIAAFVIAFIKYWKLTLILLSTVFAITLAMGSGSTFIVNYTARSQQEYAKGGTVAEEVLSSIRNATAFNTQKKLARQYDTHLIEAEQWARKLQIALAAMLSSMMTIVYLNYGLAFWQGSKFYLSGDIKIGTIITILFAVMIGAFSLGHVAPHAKAFTSAAAAGRKIFAAIDRESPINPNSKDGKKLDSVQGTIELRHIKHIYPSRPEVVVMDDVNLLVPAGKQTALVGASGSGKSTVVGLVERFYDPVGGEVLLDSVNIQELNLRWLRQHISLVQQEPVLFATTIYENIRYGLLGTDHEQLPKDKVSEMIENAAKMANAHDFICSLPEGYQTNVGERGFLLSGGQKQRVAIARAVVSDPKILLLDEATSALDTKSEGVVQAALDKATQGRTTIVIAHRLSTIKHADNIVVMQEGRIVEQGKHDDLLDKRGAYYNLVEAQRIAAERDTTDEEEEEEIVTKQVSQELCGPTEEKTLERSLPEDPDDARLAMKRSQTTVSASVSALEKKSKDDDVEYSLWTLMKTVWSFNREEWWIMMIGFFFSVIAGGGHPTQAVVFSKAVTTLTFDKGSELRSKVDFWSLMYLMLAFTQAISYMGHGWAFGYCSERLVHRTRDRAFRAMLRQDIGFFDKEENNAGALTSFLSTQTTHLAGLSGQTLGTILMVSTTLIAALTVSLAIYWKLALVCTSTIPVLLICGFLRFWMLARFQQRSKKAYQSSAGFACEATSAIRTVASLTREDDVWQIYHQQLVDQNVASLRSVLKSSSLYASSQSLTFLCIALGFWYGGTLMAKKEIGILQFFICFSSIIFGAQSAGTLFSFAPDMGKAKQAAAELKRLYERKPEIDSWSEEGEKVQGMEGHIEFRDVHFRYPTRPEQSVLRGLNLTVKPGQYVALVGASGCGKSTTIALMERFYDPLVGGIFVDGKEISSLNLNDYRNHLALVSQEPTLYQGTVRDNVLLGADREDVPEEEIIKACKDANIYDFIMSLPDGFNTPCGTKGTLLSGGQKQRIAIARALLRDPKILLLDEATSALDSESEKVVQAALDVAAKGRTTIAVAHRLSTIQNADRIYVIDAGKIVEQGTHSELLAKKGRYAELVIMQSLEKAG